MFEKKLEKVDAEVLKKFYSELDALKGNEVLYVRSKNEVISITAKEEEKFVLHDNDGGNSSYKKSDLFAGVLKALHLKVAQELTYTKQLTAPEVEIEIKRPTNRPVLGGGGGRSGGGGHG